LPDSEWSAELPMRPKPMMATSQVRMKYPSQKELRRFGARLRPREQAECRTKLADLQDAPMTPSARRPDRSFQ
jgi:hypothetical protein